MKLINIGILLFSTFSLHTKFIFLTVTASLIFFLSLYVFLRLYIPMFKASKERHSLSLD